MDKDKLNLPTSQQDMLDALAKVSPSVSPVRSRTGRGAGRLALAEWELNLSGCRRTLTSTTSGCVILAQHSHLALGAFGYRAGRGTGEGGLQRPPDPCRSWLAKLRAREAERGYKATVSIPILVVPIVAIATLFPFGIGTVHCHTARKDGSHVRACARPPALP